MAEVFEGSTLGAEGFVRPVAIKRIIPAMSIDPAFGNMFINEARIASLLQHENIVSVLDFDLDPEGHYFLVMELVRGIDLRRLASSGPLPLPVIAYIACKVLDGLFYAHELEHDGRRLGIVHRDVSPHNVMVSWDGTIKVVDFGIAKAFAATETSRSGGIKGKVAYMSPEQVHAADLDGRSDIFAVGVMVHELVTGERLFPGATEAEILARMLTQPIPSLRQLCPDIPADFEAVVMCMLERDRNARHPDAHAAQEALLATSVIDPRAQLQLREILRQRFPDAPRRRRDSEPAFAMSSSGPVPVAAAGTVPRGASARDLMARPTRTAAPAWAQSTATARPRTRAWLAVAGAVAVIAAVVVVLATAGDGKRAGDAPAADASLAGPGDDQAPWPDAGVAPVAVIDGAALAPAIEPDEPRAGPDHRRHGASADAAPPDAAPPVIVDAAVAVAPPVADTPVPAKPKEPGILDIKIEPWAQVYINGKFFPTPVLETLPPGGYQVRLFNPENDHDETRLVEVRSGQTTRIREDWREK